MSNKKARKQHLPLIKYLSNTATPFEGYSHRQHRKHRKKISIKKRIQEQIDQEEFKKIKQKL
jgi:hypothetical protein